jgi:O-acetylhomoserine (thiol)-lyase
MNNSLKPETLCVQGGWQPKKGEPRVLPIYQSTTFKYDTSEQMAKLFDLEESGYFYTRLQNPTNDAVAAKIAALEGGVGAMLTSSGQAANFYAVFNICQAGDHMVCSSTIYGGTFNLFGVTMKKLGIEVTFVDPDASEEEISAAFRPNTKALFGETLSNPGMSVLDIEKFARIAHSHGVPLIVDNTFATPINCRPFEWGADIVTHSTTKYMDGHATSVGGAVVDSGNFDWDAHADKFPGLTTPDESYHGLTYTKAFGKMAYMTKATAQLMRDLGSIQAPMNAFLEFRTRNLAPAYASTLQERPTGCRMARSKRAGRLGELPRIKEQQILRAGTKIHAERDLWRDRFRPERFPRRCDPLYG